MNAQQIAKLRAAFERQRDEASSALKEALVSGRRAVEHRLRAEIDCWHNAMALLDAHALEAQAESSQSTSDISASVSAGHVPASSTHYVVTYAHDHPTLQIGDVVAMAESPKFDFHLIRVCDTTLHSIRDKSDQYVHLKKEQS